MTYSVIVKSRQSQGGYQLFCFFVRHKDNDIGKIEAATARRAHKIYEQF